MSHDFSVTESTRKGNPKAGISVKQSKLTSPRHRNTTELNILISLSDKRYRHLRCTTRPGGGVTDRNGQRNQT
jgi:hypothetical protein